MSHTKTLAYLLTRDLYERRERLSGRAYYVAFDTGEHVMELRNEYRALEAERDKLRRAIKEAVEFLRNDAYRTRVSNSLATLESALKERSEESA